MSGVRLNDCDNATPGLCYSTLLISRSDTPHPKADQVSRACTYMHVTFGGVCIYSIYFKDMSEQQLKKGLEGRFWFIYHLFHHEVSRNLLVVVMLQYPLHLYSTVILRTNNASLFQGKTGNESGGILDRCWPWLWRWSIFC